MWPITAFTKLANISLPIIQAPMSGGATTPELIAAVSNAGGLGSLGAGYMQPAEIEAAIQKTRQLTDKPFSINLFVPVEHNATLLQMQAMQKILQTVAQKLHIEVDIPSPPFLPDFDAQIDVVLQTNIPIVSFTFGIPAKKHLQVLKQKNILIIGTATSIKEALLWQENGADFIAAQGAEAGGHRGTFAHSMEEGLIESTTLIPQIVNTVKVPVIAAGAIMNAQDIMKFIQLGACAVQMGTAFLACYESGIPSVYKQALLSAKKNNTVLTKAFSGKYARGLNNRFITTMLSHDNDILEYPIQNAFTQPLRKAAAQQNNADFLSMWAGQGVALCKECSAAELIVQLKNDMQKLMK